MTKKKGDNKISFPSDEASPLHNIIIKNAHQNNLKNLNLIIPHNIFTVITGVSGSGKSSLAFETIYEEGRRRYVESLSSYVRQFLGKIQKPKVDLIKGLPPAIAIEQKRSSSSSRSTVGTVTEIYHYIKILFARCGTLYSPMSGNKVERHEVKDITDFIIRQADQSVIRILAPLIKLAQRKIEEELSLLLQKGFTRIYCNDNEFIVEDILTVDDTNAKHRYEYDCLQTNEISIIIDRLMLDQTDKDQKSRIDDSVQTALMEGKGRCSVQIDNNKPLYFSNKLESDGMSFEEPTPDLFSFNSPYGACPDCNGYGELLGIDEDKVIVNKSLNLYNGAVSCWEGEKMSKWKMDFISKAAEFDFPIFTIYRELSEDQKDLLWEGNKKTYGINDFFRHLEENTYKVHYRIMLSRYRGRTKCRSCKGSRIRKEAHYFKIADKDIGQILDLSIGMLYDFFQKYAEDNKNNKIVSVLMKEINTRLRMMNDIGLGYLTLNRSSRSLSGGEMQRIQLIYLLGSNLTGSLYVLDEPSIGLHPRDTRQLIRLLMELKEKGNSIIVVEHDEDIIRAADMIVDLGPDAGTGGGEIVFIGDHEKIKKQSMGLTAAYLNAEITISKREKNRDFDQWIHFEGASKHNLKNIDVSIPLHAMTVVSGVSGSGKTTLVKEVIFESLKSTLTSGITEAVNCQQIGGAVRSISKLEFVSQDSIERSRRSNAVTYLKVYDAIRELFSNQPMGKANGYSPAFFSFNVEGGRCEECKGDGMITVEMQFVADLHLICEECKGKRFKDEILEVKYRDKNIFDVLSMTVREAMDFFSDHKGIQLGLMPLLKVGLDYLQLGQSTSTLSGGEAQRLKLASFLTKGKAQEPVFFIFDEPTTGLHWHDIQKLLSSFDELLLKGHSLLVIEHNPHIILNADYIIDLGKDGGEAGGYVVYQGYADALLSAEESYTAEYLRQKKVSEQSKND